MRYWMLMLALLGLLIATAAQAAPSLTASSDRAKWAVNDTGIFTVTMAVPAADAATIAAPTITLPVPAGWQATSASGKGPRVIQNTATATWTGGSVSSNPVSFRVQGATLAASVGSSSVTLAVADGVEPGETVTLTVALKRVC